MKLDLPLTLAAASLVLLVGQYLVNRIPALGRTAIPAPVVGGLLFALLALACPVSIDTSLRAPLQTLFFTTIGMGASTELIRRGGRPLILLWIIASLAAVVQNLAGIAAALLLGVPADLGIIAGALTLTGGPATGLAFATVFESRGLPQAAELIIASATFGILAASLVGNPVATLLIRRTITPLAAASSPVQAARPPIERLLLHVMVLLLVSGAGTLLSSVITRTGFLLPSYIGAMVLGFLLRTRWQPNPATMDAIGATALAYFLAIALMDLKLAKLASLAIPLLLILTLQVVVTVAYSVASVFFLGRRDYESAVTTSGLIGFLLGITPNAVANMEALIRRYGAAPQSLLTVTITGAFLIDFSNSLIITLFLNR
jgi:ESS family glutamate:Na+ symporter